MTASCWELLQIIFRLKLSGLCWCEWLISAAQWQPCDDEWIQKQPQVFCCLVVVADEQLLCLKAVLLNFSRDAGSSLGVAALGLSSRAGGGAQVFPMAPPVLPQDKVVVGSGAHGIEYIGFVGNQELWVRKNTIYFHLAHFCLIAVFLRITCRAIFRNASILNPFRENDSIIGSSELFSSWEFKP